MLPGNKNVQEFLRQSAGKPSKFGVVQPAALGSSCIAPQSLRSRSFELKNGVVHVGAFSVLMKDSCTIGIFGKKCRFCCLAPLLVFEGVRGPPRGVRGPSGGARGCSGVSGAPLEVGLPDVGAPSLFFFPTLRKRYFPAQIGHADARK